MGSLNLAGMLEVADTDAALFWHLTSNHYPPIHTDFHDDIKAAITLAQDGSWGEEIELPNGRQLTVAEIIEQLHLETFVYTEESEEPE